MNIQKMVGVIINIHKVDDVYMNIYKAEDVPQIVVSGNSNFIKCRCISLLSSLFWCLNDLLFYFR